MQSYLLVPPCGYFEDNNFNISCKMAPHSVDRHNTFLCYTDMYVSSASDSCLSVVGSSCHVLCSVDRLYLTNSVTCQQNYLLLQQCSHPLYLHYLCLLSSTLSLLPYQSVVTVHMLIYYITSGVCYMLMCLILVCCRTKDACRSCSQGR